MLIKLLIALLSVLDPQPPAHHKTTSDVAAEKAALEGTGVGHPGLVEILDQALPSDGN